MTREEKEKVVCKAYLNARIIRLNLYEDITHECVQKIARELLAELSDAETKHDSNSPGYADDGTDLRDFGISKTRG